MGFLNLSKILVLAHFILRKFIPILILEYLNKILLLFIKLKVAKIKLNYWIKCKLEIILYIIMLSQYITKRFIILIFITPKT